MPHSIRSHQLPSRRQWLAAMLAGSAPGWARALQAGGPTGITWYLYELPPISILNGPDMAHGINNAATKRMMAGLPGYQHSTRVAGFNRITENLRAGEAALCVGLQKTPEKEAFLAFSVPFTIALAPGVVALKSQAQRLRAALDADGMLPLDKVLAGGTLKLGIAAGRSYTPAVNSVLAAHKGSASVVVRNGENISTGLLGMLEAGRFDFTLMYAEEAQYFARQLKGKMELVSIPVREAPGAATIHVAGPKTAWGEGLLATLNPLILKFRDTPDYHREREYWMDDSTRKRYREQVRGVFAKG